MSREVQITFDCADPDVVARFSEVLGYQLPVDGTGPRLFFQRVPEGRSAKNRVHLDVRAAPGIPNEDRMEALETEAERLVALGASRQHRFEPQPGPGFGHIVMQDPEGNEFCLD